MRNIGDAAARAVRLDVRLLSASVAAGRPAQQPVRGPDRATDRRAVRSAARLGDRTGRHGDATQGIAERDDRGGKGALRPRPGDQRALSVGRRRGAGRAILCDRHRSRGGGQARALPAGRRGADA